jgi:glycosyltransferase involved in cell wall biosynthesis
VCVATYNGARYVEHQLRSILAELEPSDEVIVVDDASRDTTVEIVRSIDDPRIRIIPLTANGGYVHAFETAMSAARGDVLFLADQDDEWVPGRRAALVAGLQHGEVCASNLELLGTGEALRSPLTGKPWRLTENGSALRNQAHILAGTAPYYGCAMALRRSALGYVLPFPEGLRESHDLWIATAANARHELQHTDAVTVRRRVHDANASTSRPRAVGAVLRSRLLMVKLWREASRRKRRDRA